MTKETSVTRPRPASSNSGGKATFPATLPKDARILRRADFRLVYDHGIRFPGPLFAAFCLAQPFSTKPDAGSPPAPRNSARIGLTVPRAVGRAVERNRIKRRLREIFRMHRTKLDPRWDIVLNPRRASLAASFLELDRAVLKVIERCNSR